MQFMRYGSRCGPRRMFVTCASIGRKVSRFNRPNVRDGRSTARPNLTFNRRVALATVDGTLKTTAVDDPHRPSTGENVEAVASCSGGVIASVDAGTYGVSLASRLAPSTPGRVLLRKRSDALIALLLSETNRALRVQRNFLDRIRRTQRWSPHKKHDTNNEMHVVAGGSMHNHLNMGRRRPGPSGGAPEEPGEREASSERPHAWLANAGSFGVFLGADMSAYRFVSDRGTRRCC
jgi:hypothetical protein